MIEDLASKFTDKSNKVGKEADIILAQLKNQHDDCSLDATKAREKFEYAMSTIQELRDDLQNIFDAKTGLTERWKRSASTRTAKRFHWFGMLANARMTKSPLNSADLAGGALDVEHDILSAQNRCYDAIFGAPNNVDSVEDVQADGE